MYEKYRAQGFAMVAINVTPGQNAQLAQWRARGHYTFPVLLVPGPGYASSEYGVGGTPTNLLVDADARVMFRHIGYGVGAERIIEAEIRDLLGLDPFEGIEPAKAQR